MLENQLLKLAEGLNLELKRTAEIQYINELYKSLLMSSIKYIIQN